jgi:hypothetical protein
MYTKAPKSRLIMRKAIGQMRVPPPPKALLMTQPQEIKL